MSEVDRLLSDYIAEHRAGGEADPLAYLDQLEGADREELAALLDAYLQRAPGREWDPESYRGSPAERLTAALDRSLRGHAGLWPVVLPRLRERAKVRRADLVKRLAGALGVGGQAEKVEGYYHAMEQGTLDSTGVSSRVLDALAGIVGASPESLRKAGENLGEAVAIGDEDAVVFTRVTGADADALDLVAESAAPAHAKREWDEVDKLFLGGD